MATLDYTLDDFRRQMREIRRIGSMAEVMKMIPGMSDLASRLAASDPDQDLRLIEGMINSMTAQERAECELIEDSRCRRIARGSGSRPEDVEKLLRDFRAMQQMMQKFAGMGMMERMRRPRMNRDGSDGFRNFELN